MPFSPIDLSTLKKVGKTRMTFLVISLTVVGVGGLLVRNQIDSRKITVDSQASTLGADIQRMSIVPNIDTNVREDQPDVNFNSDRGLRVGRRWDNNTISRALLKFNLMDIPSGSNVTSAILYLHLSGTTAGDLPTPITIRRVLNDEALTETITWNRHFGLQWDNNTVSSSDIGSDLVQYTWDLTPLVQAWAQEYSSKPLALIVVGDEENERKYRAFWSKECYPSDCSNEDMKPHLVIQYREPSPTNTPSLSPTASPTPTATATPPPASTETPTPSVTPQDNCPRRQEGDANCDGNVDEADFDCWKAEFTGNPISGCSSADFDRSGGKADILDFEIWRKTYANHNR